MFSHITPSFIAAAVSLFGVMALSPHLHQIRARRREELDQIQPFLNEVQEKWKAQAKIDRQWRMKMNQELSDVWDRHGMSPWDGIKEAGLELAIYLVLWVLLIVSSADMIRRF